MSNIDKAYCHLSLLMSALNVTTKELAEILHVDQSLVSKWRNNKRQLAANSVYLAPICTYFLDIDTTRQLNIIDPILQSFDNNIDINNQEEKLNCISRWLISSSTLELPILASLANKTHSYETTIRIWNGLSGRQDAVLFFLDQVLSLSNPTQLLLVSQEDISWMTENTDFLQKWQAKLIAVLNKGHTIKIIHWVDRSANIINSIIQYWLPLHLTGKIQSWYAPSYIDLPYQITFFIAENTLVLSGISPATTPKSTVSTIAADPSSLQQYTTIFNSMITQYHRFIDVVDFNNLPDLMKKSLNTIGSETFYCLFSIPPLIFISPQLLQDILISNDCSLDEFNRVITFQQKLTDYFYTCPLNNAIPICYMMDEEGLFNYLSDAGSANPELSFLLKRPINLEKTHRVKQLQEMMQLVEDSSTIELGLSISTEKTPINLSAYPNQLVIAYSQLLQYPYALSTSEPTVVNATYKYLESHWYEIPRIKRNKDDIIDLLQSLIST